MSLANEDLRAVLRDPLSAARRSTRPCVAFATNNVPTELIHAAGCFPLQIPTAPRADTSRADRYLEARFDPLVRSAFELLLAGELDEARLAVLPRSNDSWMRLYYYLCELKRNFEERLPEPFLYDLLHTPSEHSAAYNAESTRLLAQKLTALSGARLDRGALTSSITRYNRIRRKLERVQALRHERPCRLSGADACSIYIAAQRLEPEALERALDVELARPFEPVAGVRTLLVGSAHDTPIFHELVARAGGQVVADHHIRGDLLLGPAVAEQGDPLHALCEHYHRRSLSVRTFPSPLGELVQLARQSHAEAAVFFYYDQEEALTWDYPEQSAALRACGIPTLLLDRESYPPSPEVTPQLRRFYAQLC